MDTCQEVSKVNDLINLNQLLNEYFCQALSEFIGWWVFKLTFGDNFR